MIVECILFVILICGLYFINKKPSQYPPGYWGLPLFGYIPFSRKPLLDQLFAARKKFGDIVIWRMGVRHVVFLFDFHTIRKIFSSQDSASRPPYLALTNFVDWYENTGLLGSNDKVWHDIRRFSLRVLKDLGMGKSKMVDDIQYEVEDFVQHALKTKGEPGSIPKALFTNMLNVSWKLIADTRFEAGDPKVIAVDKMIMDVLSSLNTFSVLDFFPWSRKLIPSWIISKYLIGKGEHAKTQLKEFLGEIIQNHRENLDVNDPKDFIDDFLIEQMNQKDNPDSVMTDQNMLCSVMDLYIAGSETGIGSLRWVIFYLIAYPEVQRKAQDEVDKVLGKDPFRLMETQNELHYIKSVMYEVQRCSSIVPSAGIRMAERDIEVDGYVIPSNAMMVPVADACHYNPKFWKNPKEFRPERFLDETGKFVAPKEGHIPFGVGKRICVGESIAKLELIMFIVGILQHLTISAPEGKSVNLKPATLNFFLRLSDTKQSVVFKPR